MYINDYAIYHDSDVTRWHFDQLSYQNIYFKPGSYHLGYLDDFIQSSKPNKLACFHVPFPEETSWLDRVKIVSPHADQVLIFCSELHEPTVQQLNQLDLDRFKFFLCGHFNKDLEHASVHTWMNFFIITSHFYKHIKPQLLEQKLLANTAEKPKKFDILLGGKRTHRDFVNNYIVSHDLESEVIMTYYDTITRALDQQGFILETEGLEFIPGRTVRWSIDNVMYYGNEKALSQIIPISIYNQTYYSFITETNAWNHFSFFTEKTVKPILAGRLFLAVCGQYFLRNLRSLGFKTFDGIIDESYDQEKVYEVRWSMVMEQMKLLCQRDPVEVYQQAQHIVEHNRALMLNHDWQADVCNEIKKILVK